MDIVPVPKKQGQVKQIHGGVGRSVSQLLLGPPAPNFLWRFLEHIGTFVDHLGGVDPTMGRVPVPKNQAKLSKYMEEWGGQYLSFY